MVCIDITCDCDAIITSYKKRWQVEVFHKNLKSNAGLAKSPTQTLRTQSSYVLMSIYAVFKLECLSIRIQLNRTALRFKLLTNAARSVFEKLRLSQAAPAAASGHVLLVKYVVNEQTAAVPLSLVASQSPQHTTSGSGRPGTAHARCPPLT